MVHLNRDSVEKVWKSEIQNCTEQLLYRRRLNTRGFFQPTQRWEAEAVKSAEKVKRKQFSDSPSNFAMLGGNECEGNQWVLPFSCCT